MLSFALFAAVVFVPALVAAAGSPALTLVVALAAIEAWRRLGPRPLPGLLPGAMALTVVLVDLTVVVEALLRLAAP
ncbi:MAG: hypothetical protein R3B09_25810 [Nannocystaceae bacterium]